jgi:hypothetical protein
MRVLFLFLAFTIATVARSQTIAFVVYYTKGSITKAGTAGSLKRGDKLYAKDNITLSQNAQIILVCKNSQTVKLVTKGKYAVSSLVKDCDKKTPSFVSSYFSYVWKEFTTPHGDMDEDPTHYMKNTGAASRGCNTVETKLILDTVILPLYKPGMVARSFPVFFNTIFEKPNLSRFISTDEGDSVWQTSISKNMFRFDILSKEAGKAGISYWQITGNVESTCDPNVLIILSEKEYNAAVGKMLTGLPAASAAETAYMKAFILEENHFIGEAFRYYEQAYKLAPTNQKYKLARSRFYE